MHLTSNDITIFIFSISVMLFCARLFGEVFRKLHQPVVIGEIIAGIFLGPSFFGLLFPELYSSIFNSSPIVEITLQGIVELAIVMLMLVTGLEVDLSIVFSQGKKASLISFFSIAFPMLIGFGFSYLFPQFFGDISEEKKLFFALFIGTALSVTALPVVVRMLMDLNIFKTEIGTIIITAAMFTDIFGWIFFSFILGSIGSSNSQHSIQNQIVTILIFILVLLFIGRKVFNSIIKFLERFTISIGGVISFIFIIGFLGAAFTQYIGLHAILGAFLVGIALGDSVHIKEETREIVQQFATNIFAPLFFVSIGLRLNFIQNFDLKIILILLALSIIGKVLGSLFGSYLSGIKTNDSFIIGFGMNAYGAMQIVLSLVAKQVGLINDRIFVSLVVLAITTSILSAPVMSFFIKRAKRKLNFIDLLNKDLIFFSDAKTKNEIIEELCKKVSAKTKLNYNLVLENVMERENQMSTGLANHLAVPHAKLKINSIVIAVAINKDGIDFDSLDGRKTHVIILLLTPIDQPEAQLKLLSDIAKFFNSPDIAQKLISVSSKEEVIVSLEQISKNKFA
jgi:Kef-type K+ transport system membrane component KefB/mannitol/fructose-specific phosphotransferase system IIA component (Ntr-type)